jgi:hypothetical protein
LAKRTNRRKIFRGLLLVVAIFLLYAGYHVVSYLNSDVNLRHYLLHNSLPSLKDQMFGVEKVFPDADENDSETYTTEIDVPEFHINFDDSVTVALQQDIDNKLNNSQLFTDDPNPWHAAALRYSGADFEVKLRLRGDMRDNYHFGLENASFRINLKSDERIPFQSNGTSTGQYRKFSLIRPFHENGFYGYFYYKFMDQLRFLSNDFRFVTLVLNGENTGLWILQEAFYEHLHSGLGRGGSGLIFKFRNDCSELDEMYNPSGLPQIDVYQEGKLAEDTILAKEYRYLNRMLMLIHTEQAPVDSLFDVREWARFAAWSDIFYGHHAMACHNARLFYDGDGTKLVEPIAWDPKSYGFLPYKSPTTFLSHYVNDYPIYKLLKADPSFAHWYLVELEKCIADTTFNAFYAEHKYVSDQLQHRITEPRSTPRFDPTYIQNTKDFLDRQFHIADPVYLELQPEKQVLYVQNRSVLPIIIQSIEWHEKGSETPTRMELEETFFTSKAIPLSKLPTGKFKVYYRLPTQSTLREIEGW